MKSLHLFLLGVMAFGAAPSAAWADEAPPARPNLKAMKHEPEGPPGKHAREGAPGKHDGEHKHEGDREKGDGGAPEKPEGPGAQGARDGGPPGHGPYRNAVRELFQDLKAGKITKDELKQKLTQLHQTTGERKKEHREELGKRWGNVLAKPPARDELKVHARRMAFLNRALVLAQSDTKPDKEKTIERITKLIDKENARHEQAMTRIQSQPAPTASAQPTTAASAVSENNGGSK